MPTMQHGQVVVLVDLVVTTPGRMQVGSLWDSSAKRLKAAEVKELLAGNETQPAR